VLGLVVAVGVTARTVHDLAHDVVVPSEGSAHPLGITLPEAGAPLHVTEENGDGPCRGGPHGCEI
jgi:hypothetical protein